MKHDRQPLPTFFDHFRRQSGAKREPKSCPRRIKAWALIAALALTPVGGVPGVVFTIATGTAILTTPTQAEARMRFRSSGGYSRPSIRTPSIGGGYGRGFGFSRRPSTGFPSAGDRAISGRGAAEALRSYRERGRQAAPPASVPSGSFGRRGYGGAYGARPDWTVRRGWSIPTYAYRSPPSFGIWNGLFLWFLLDTLSRPGHAAFFYNHQNDPGYQSWRADAERQARDDPELQAKLNALDQQLAAQKGQPRDPNYLPPGASPEIALAGNAETGSRPPSAGTGTLLIVVVLGGGFLFLLWRWRQRDAERLAGHTADAGGVGHNGGKPIMSGPLASATEMIRRKLSGEPYKPSLFRVGMTVTMDPTPFILAAGATKVPVPHVAGPNLLASVEAVGTLSSNGVILHRLYLDEKSFFQLHLDPAGMPDECRFFGRIDEVMPASAEDWAFWLDPQEGLIGWPQFQAKDGKVYERVWAPGASWIPPRAFTETRATLGGTTTAKLQAMLYGAGTGAAAPAPETEYILVAMVESGGQARIAIHAGIDVNPAALSLA